MVRHLKQKDRSTPISAVILAAGLSSRMGDFKPLLPLGKTTIVETAINLFKAHQINDIVVVTGHNYNLLEPIVKKAGALPIFNCEYSSGMLSSIQKGVQNIRPEYSGFFLLPVDIPAIRPSTIKLMIQQFQKTPDKIILPYFDDTPGHPPLIPVGLKTDILNLCDGSTLRDVMLSPENQKIPLKVYDRGILMDADDKQGYEHICQKFNSLNIPDKEECLSIINDILPENDPIRIHLAEVSFAALKIANGLPHQLNTDLVIAAAILHDIKRKEKNHAKAGAKFIRDLGFAEVSAIITQHMDIDIDTASEVNEKEVVYFADKLCNGNGVDLNYHKRFSENLMKFPWAITSISKRYENTKLIQARIEESAGKSVREIISS
ncbi:MULTISPECIES: DVU_1551 family NTP transferase [Desulfobacula]|uniref:Metal-dependent phosphohydrolase n=2 Tax=Desulfobacula TaxID=28222 RepID=K0NFN0_DESTT|nr:MULTISPECIES: NTP transferase domain-containing protein [Desulfobacula]CCK79740.1 metal-dependent phosphohydrolase [Desulfobacula toluolica Tol2]